MTYLCGDESRRLVEEIGGTDRLVKLCDRFYEKVFKDSHVDQFVVDRTEPHGYRLGTWISDKMTGNVTYIRDPDARTRAHARAWMCPKRSTGQRGLRFKLPDCRVWMRLMFWSVHEEGLDKHKEFYDFFLRFIGAFIRVYEVTAPPFTKESAEWSKKPENIEKYISDGRKMTDVIGYHVHY
eukprot:TRINITY_DN2819_c0_g4_i1.p1 TRINITY_DN2819_c0_g4~~TRINITY_DN2819_c0_g4_i1.p1  ORF type:complete len:181 (+),score=29.84 TRINITY_DN2819_c0_g4_i1:74-616(+)